MIDLLLLALLLAAVVLALCFIRRRRLLFSCGGDCTRCAHGCTASREKSQKQG